VRVEAGEPSEIVEARRRGQPFLAFRDKHECQRVLSLEDTWDRVTIGRGPSNDIGLPWDEEVSRVHAEVVRIADDWAVVDDGLSRNGTFVNGDRVSGRRRLRDGDAMRFGQTLVVFRAPGAVAAGTVAAGDTPDAASVTDTQRRILVALCRPYREGSEFATPATNKGIAAEVFLSVDAVKAHLRTLFERFGVGELPQNEKRVRLAELALRSGVVAPRDLER
jgi:pSer/pThr/pTyr-binding forkhead associated (FHA) protein